MIASIILILFVTSLIAIIKTTFFKSNKSPKIKNSDNFIKQNQNNTFEKQSVNDNDMYLPINTLLQNGKYKIEKVLGNGTFGITYLATTKVKIGGQLGNMEATIKVAIKEFFMEAINGRTGTSVTSGNTDGTYDKYKKKFIKEAQNMSKMNHPNIVKVSDIFEANNTCYYVMEYCEGGSLDELIKRKGCLGEAESMIYIRQITNALKYMHDNKMLHLDLKPGNVVLRENGDAVLIDFGLSKQFDKNGKAETSTNVGLGTPGYAPIEQSNYDGSTFPVTMDVYALGGTWFKMLTGTCPPDASTILNQGFPAYELQNKNVSERSVQCIARAMQPLYKDRIQDVGEFMKMLGKGETKSEDTILEKEYKGGNVDKPKSKQNENRRILSPDNKTNLFERLFWLYKKSWSEKHWFANVVFNIYFIFLFCVLYTIIRIMNGYHLLGFYEIYGDRLSLIVCIINIVGLYMLYFKNIKKCFWLILLFPMYDNIYHCYISNFFLEPETIMINIYIMLLLIIVMFVKKNGISTYSLLK